MGSTPSTRPSAVIPASTGLPVPSTSTASSAASPPPAPRTAVTARATSTTTSSARPAVASGSATTPSTSAVTGKRDERCAPDEVQRHVLPHLDGGDRRTYRRLARLAC